MPAWDYRCSNGHTFTVQGSIDNFSPHQPCPKCSKEAGRYFGAQVVAIHGGPTTSADAKVDPWRSAGARR